MHSALARETTALRRSTIDIDGIRSPVLEAGPGGAPEAAVFVHGNPGSSEDWARLIEQVGSFSRAVAWDHPGFGRADKPEDFAYSVEGYAAHLERARQVLGLERLHLVLHDFGGPWGLTWAAQHSAAFGSAVLINTGVLLGYRWHYLARIWRTPGLGEVFMMTATRSGFRLLLRHGNPKGLPRAFIDRMYDDFDAGTKRAVLRLYRATGAPGKAAQALFAALQPLDRPALVIWGKHDPYIPVKQADRQRESFPGAEIIILERSGHWPFADDPEAVEAHAVPFLEQQMKEAREE